MPLPDQNTVFAKAVCRTMTSYGYHLGDDVRAFALALPEDAWFSSRMFEFMICDVRSALRDCLSHDPLRVLQFSTDITYLVKPGALITYRSLMRNLFHHDMPLLAVWSRAAEIENARHAFGLYMLTCDFNGSQNYHLSRTISNVIGAGFSLNRDPTKCRDGVAIAMFGPAWHSLFMHADMKDDDLIDLVLHQRPPVIGCTVDLAHTVVLPPEM